MASGGSDPASGDGRHTAKRSYERENTLLIDVVDNNRVKAKEVIDSLTELLGEGVVYTCVKKTGNIYEVTLADGDSLKVASGGVKVGDQTFDCREVVQNTVVVSFMHMSGYIADSDIESKLRELGVEIVGEIKRKMHPGTKVEDGTRYVRVKFPPTIQSLPYTMRFFNGKVWEHIRVIHNDQTKVCRQCMSVEHLFRECPDFLCWKCGKQGHLARLCKAPRCAECGKYGDNCDCNDDMIEKCKWCGQFDCECVICDHCEKPKPDCICLPDDICTFCAVELENCQCIECEHCGQYTSSCSCEVSMTPVLVVTSDQTQAISGAASDQPTDAVDDRDGKRPAVNQTDQPSVTQVSGADAGDDCVTGGDSRVEDEVLAEPNRPQINGGITRQSLRSRQATKDNDEKSVEKKQWTVRFMDGCDDIDLTKKKKRRRRLVSEPNLPGLERKKQNIDCDITVE